MILEWLKRELSDRCIKQKQLGEAIGWNESTTSKVLRGERRITGDELIDIFVYLGYPNPIQGERVPSPGEIAGLAAGIDKSALGAVATLLQALRR